MTDTAASAQRVPAEVSVGVRVRAHPALCEGWGNCHRFAAAVYPLDAEGYLNFGWLGVFATFLAIGLLQRRTFNMRRARDFVIYYAVFLSGFTMYCLRNDSIALFKGHLYAVVAYAALRWLAQFLPREPRSAPRS